MKHEIESPLNGLGLCIHARRYKGQLRDIREWYEHLHGVLRQADQKPVPWWRRWLGRFGA